MSRLVVESLAKINPRKRGFRQRGLSVIGVLIAIIIVIPAMIGLIQLTHQMSVANERMKAVREARLDVENLLDRLGNDARSSIAEYTVAPCAVTDAPCSEIRFYGLDVNGAGHFWGYAYDAMAQLVQPCIYAAFDAPCTPTGEAIPNISVFSVTPILASQLNIPVLNGYPVRDVAFEAITPSIDPQGRVVAGNRVMRVLAENAYEGRQKDLLAAARPSSAKVMTAAYIPPSPPAAPPSPGGPGGGPVPEPTVTPGAPPPPATPGPIPSPPSGGPPDPSTTMQYVYLTLYPQKATLGDPTSGSLVSQNYWENITCKPTDPANPNGSQECTWPTTVAYEVLTQSFATVSAAEGELGQYINGFSSQGAGCNRIIICIGGYGGAIQPPSTPSILGFGGQFDGEAGGIDCKQTAQNGGTCTPGGYLQGEAIALQNYLSSHPEIFSPSLPLMFVQISLVGANYTTGTISPSDTCTTNYDSGVKTCVNNLPFKSEGQCIGNPLPYDFASNVPAPFDPRPYWAASYALLGRVGGTFIDPPYFVPQPLAIIGTPPCILVPN